MHARTVLFACLILLASPLHADEAPTFADAQRLTREGDLPGAIVAARAVLDADPGNVGAGRLLLDLLNLAGRRAECAKAVPAKAPAIVRRGLEARFLPPRQAAAELAAVLKEEGADERFRLDLAGAQLKLDRASAAESEAAQYVKAHADDAEGHTVLGSVQAARGKNTPARAAFERALELVPGCPRAAVGLAEVLSGDKHAKEGRAALTKALEVYPKNPVLRRGLAEDHARAGEHADAIRVLRDLLNLPVAKCEVHVRLAEVNRAAKRYAEVARSAKAALAEEASATPHLKARALRAQGFVKQKRDDYAGALTDYRQALRLQPGWALLHVDIAFVLTLQDDLKGAEKELKAALKLDKNLLDAHLRLGIVLYLGSKYKAAKKELNAVLKRDKNHAPAHRYTGYVLVAEGKNKAAIKSFNKVAELLPEDSSSLRMVGRAHLAMGKIDKALDAFREAVARNNKDAFAYFDLGKGLAKQEKWDDAETAWTKAIGLDPKLCHPHLYLAELFDDVRGDQDKALPHYKSYLELGGDDEGGSIKKRIEQIEGN